MRFFTSESPDPSTMSSSESTHCTDGSSRRNMRRRRAQHVAFDNETLIIEIPVLASYTDKEKKALWYSERELGKLKRRTQRLVANGGVLDEKVDCWRGLEYYSENERTKRLSSSPQSKQEAAMMSDLRAAQDCAEAYIIYLETMDAELVNCHFR